MYTYIHYIGKEESTLHKKLVLRLLYKKVKYSGSGLGEEYLASSFLQLTRLSYIYSKFQKTNLKLIGVHNHMMIKT